MGVGDFGVLHVAGERRDQLHAAQVEQPLDFERVATDVVFTQHVHPEWVGLSFLGQVFGADHVLEQAVVGDVVAS